MKQIIIFQYKDYRERAIKDGNEVIFVKEFFNPETEIWEDVEQKIVTYGEYKILKKLFEGKEDK